MATNNAYLPAMPEIGHPETYYARLSKHAEKMGFMHAHEAAKVGQYVTLALDPNLDWDHKQRYFRHAIKRHCIPPAVADDLVSMYYQRLGELVMHYCGQEALRLASAQDDKYAERMRDGEPRQAIMEDAVDFFAKLMGVDDRCPSHFAQEDWAQLKLLRSQWIPELDSPSPDGEMDDAEARPVRR